MHPLQLEGQSVPGNLGWLIVNLVQVELNYLESGSNENCIRSNNSEVCSQWSTKCADTPREAIWVPVSLEAQKLGALNGEFHTLIHV